MGKARSKKHSRHQPYQASNRPAGAGGATTGAVYTTLDADLGSLDQSKRQKACMLLSDLYLFNITNEQSIDTLTSASILGKLAMRLVDSSDKVRVQAAGALKNLSESSDIRVVRKLVSCGIVRSALTLSLEAVSMGMGGWEAIGAMGVEYLEQLLHTLANTLATEQTQTQNTQNTQSTQNTAGQRGGPLHELLSCADFAPRLLSLLDVRTPAGVLSGALHLLLLLSELAPATLGGGGGGDGGRASLLRLWGFAESLQ
ncbi:hypothetical protein B484DRAFT_426216 [Ochromonadaceae sp. CCMP2298]|nr:hypothetical protein B484DRAFT_426216 [Ochromonadaceae sp. CCMP2298]